MFDDENKTIRNQQSRRQSEDKPIRTSMFDDETNQKSVKTIKTELFHHFPPLYIWRDTSSSVTYYRTVMSVISPNLLQKRKTRTYLDMWDFLAQGDLARTNFLEHSRLRIKDIDRNELAYVWHIWLATVQTVVDIVPGRVHRVWGEIVDVIRSAHLVQGSLANAASITVSASARHFWIR